MSDSESQFLAEVEAFLAGNAMKPTVLGRSALNDGKFVFDLRRAAPARSTRPTGCAGSWPSTGRGS